MRIKEWRCWVILNHSCTPPSVCVREHFCVCDGVHVGRPILDPFDDQTVFWQTLPYFPNMHLTDDEAACSFKMKTPHPLRHSSHSLMCVLVCVHHSKYGLCGRGVETVASSACIPLYMDSMDMSWMPLPPPPFLFCKEREVIYLGRNCGWAKAAGWELFRVIIPPVFSLTVVSAHFILLSCVLTGPLLREHAQ